MKRRLCILGTFAILASLAFLISRTDAQPGTVKQIVPGVWFREGDLEKMGHCNNIIIEMNGNPIWTEAGATTLAYKGVADEMKRYEPARWQAAAKERPDVGELHRDAPEP